jgi:hypothetical protein
VETVSQLRRFPYAASLEHVCTCGWGQVDFLIMGKMVTDPGNMGPLHDWMPPPIWPKVKALEPMKRFGSLGDNMQSDSDEWYAGHV